MSLEYETSHLTLAVIYQNGSCQLDVFQDTLVERKRTLSNATVRTDRQRPLSSETSLGVPTRLFTTISLVYEHHHVGRLVNSDGVQNE